jgi:hypothetical protein
MDQNVTFRTFREGDFEICKDWWEKWWGPAIPVQNREILPQDNRCFIIESNDKPVAASFLYIDPSSKMGTITWTISDPNYREEDRGFLLELLISCIESEARDIWGVEVFYTIADNKRMEHIFRRLNWYIEDSAPTYGCYKFFYNGK